MRAYEGAAIVPGVEVFEIRFGFSSRDLARKASKLIARRIGTLCKRKRWSAEIRCYVPGIPGGRRNEQ